MGLARSRGCSLPCYPTESILDFLLFWVYPATYVLVCGAYGERRKEVRDDGSSEIPDYSE